MKHNFTQPAVQMLTLARKESERLNHNFIGTEHLLLGLLALDQGIAVNLLKDYCLDLKTARQEVEREVGLGPDQKPTIKIPYTPRAKKVLALSMREAQALTHPSVGPEHILLGLLSEGDGVAARILRRQSIDFQTVRNEIMKNFGQIAPLDSDAPKPPDPVENHFTPRALQLLTSACQEAKRLGHSFAGTEHLLLGFLLLDQGISASLLKSHGLDLETTRQEIQECGGFGVATQRTGDFAYTPRIKKVLAIAAIEAKALDHQFVGMEHIFLGLLREGDSVAARVLRKHSVDIETARNEIIKGFGQVPPTADDDRQKPPESPPA